MAILRERGGTGNGFSTLVPEGGASLHRIGGVDRGCCDPRHTRAKEVPARRTGRYSYSYSYSVFSVWTSFVIESFASPKSIMAFGS